MAALLVSVSVCVYVCEVTATVIFHIHALHLTHTKNCYVLMELQVAKVIKKVLLATTLK